MEPDDLIQSPSEEHVKEKLRKEPFDPSPNEATTTQPPSRPPDTGGGG